MRTDVTEPKGECPPQTTTCLEHLACLFCCTGPLGFLLGMLGIWLWSKPLMFAGLGLLGTCGIFWSVLAYRVAVPLLP